MIRKTKCIFVTGDYVNGDGKTKNCAQEMSPHCWDSEHSSLQAVRGPTKDVSAIRCWEW